MCIPQEIWKLQTLLLKNASQHLTIVHNIRASETAHRRAHNIGVSETADNMARLHNIRKPETTETTVKMNKIKSI